MPKLSFDEARALILKNIRVLAPEPLRLLEALGQVSARAVKAKINVPDWDASALDGFALKSADIQNAQRDKPLILKVIGRVAAGRLPTHPVTGGTAIRIMTGAPMPAGADCVVGFEDSDEASRKSSDRGQVAIFKAVSSGGNIRRAGEQIKIGSIIVDKGQTIGPAQCGLMASQGLTEVSVVRLPAVAVIATGDELLQPGKKLAPAKIYCGNSNALAAQVIRCGGRPEMLTIARDTPAALKRQLERALTFDIIITTGGSAAGDRDLVKEIMAEMGKVIFSGLDMTPGKSTAFGLLRTAGQSNRRKVLHFALSGNSTAAMLTFETLVRPAILKMRGLDPRSESDGARAVREFNNPGGKTRLVWTTKESNNGLFMARPAETEGQGVLQSIASANAIAIIPPEIKKINAGETVRVLPLGWW